LLCTIRQDGSTAEWSGEDPKGRPVAVEHSEAGGLDIFGTVAPEDQAGDPDVVGVGPPGAEHDQMMRLRRRMAPGAVHDRAATSTEQTAVLANYQRYLDAFYAPRS
jgi:hypothetical protein